jgi:hypothetical protein
MSSKRSRAARAIMAETGMKYTAALREADRRHAAGREAARPKGEQAPGLAPVFREPGDAA